MKKLLPVFVLTASVAASSLAMAIPGLTPRCSSGALTLVIANKNLTSDDCYSEKSTGKYCIFDGGYASNHENVVCDDLDSIYQNENISISVGNVNGSSALVYNVYTKGNGDHYKKLRFTYSNGSAYDNCAEVFGSDAQCAITHSGNTYTLTISKR